MTTGEAAATARGTASRDWRIDALRGLAMLCVVTNHTQLESPLRDFTQAGLGFLTGAEIFVLVSGVVLGMVHRKRVAREGWRGSAGHLLGRARTLYVTSVAVAVIVYLLERLPGDAPTFVTRNPYAEGRPDLYAHDSALDLAWGIASLRIGPWAINILALYVLLLLVAPLAVWCLRTTAGTLALLAGSTALWLAAWATETELPVFPLSAGSFAVLAWQVIFVLGLAVGWHREVLQAFFTGRRAAVGIAVCVAAFTVLLAHRLVGLPGLDGLRDELFDRQFNHPLRMVNLVATTVTLYVLMRHLGPLTGLVKAALEKVGSNTLYVFTVHVFVLIAMAAVVGADSSRSVIVNLAAQAAVLLALWALVRYRVLFGIVPR